MRVLFATSECAPFAKAGGLGDVVGALPKALAKLGVDVRVVLPRYGFISPWGAERHAAPLGVPLGGSEAWCGVLETRLPGSEVPLYLLEHDALFGANRIYDGGGGPVADFARFCLLSRGALQLCRHLEWTPDVVHVHDWPTSMLPVMLNTVEARAPFEGTASVMTIHNLGHQPRFPPHALPLAGVGNDLFRPDGFEDYGELNPFKAGCYHATMLTTVSPRYAWEIRTPEGGHGLHHVMNFRGADLLGILNGIDEDLWDPSKDPLIPVHYSSSDLAGKKACKALLQRELGLEEREDVPLIGVVSRWTAQKGIDIIIEALEDLLALDVQIAMLGRGDPDLEAFLGHRSHWGQGRFCAWVGQNEAMAHRIEAGSDLFLMPSRFEPCGLNQMYSQRYGTLPIVRAIGGLEDTVEQCDPERGRGTGFKFWDLSAEALVETVARAVDVYRTRPFLFRKMQERAMELERGWGIAARKYLEVYQWAANRRRGAAVDVR